jgi:uncharacterized protein
MDIPETDGRARRCAVSGVGEAEAALVRFAIGPDGGIAPDVAARAPGRGVWLRADRATVDQAVRRNVFARALKRAARPPDDLAAMVEAQLARRCLDLLGIARRAGGLAFGWTACEEALRRGPPHWHIEAKDGAPDGRRRLLRLAASLYPPAPVCGAFTGGEIGVALGREDVVHTLLLQEGLARRWSAEIHRLAGFRAITPPEWS